MGSRGRNKVNLFKSQCVVEWLDTELQLLIERFDSVCWRNNTLIILYRIVMQQTSNLTNKECFILGRVIRVGLTDTVLKTARVLTPVGVRVSLLPLASKYTVLRQWVYSNILIIITIINNYCNRLSKKYVYFIGELGERIIPAVC